MAFKLVVAKAHNEIITSIEVKSEEAVLILKIEPDIEINNEEVNLLSNYAIETVTSPELDPEIPSTSRSTPRNLPKVVYKEIKKGSSKHPKVEKPAKPVKKDHFCPVCDKFFTEARKVKTHVERIHMKKKNFRCDLCDYTAYKKYDILLHSNNIHKSKEKLENKSTCPDCGLSFLSNSKLNMHIQRKHQKFKRFGCDVCSLRTTTLNEMRIHVKTHMSKELREIFSCSFCNAVFYSKGSLKNHKDVKHDVNKREYICFCGKIFRLKSVYQRHFNVVHMGEKNYKCDQCPKSFAVKAHLENHREAIHTIQTGIPCDKCGLVLKNNETLKKHLIYHLPPRYQCTTCFKMFHENKKLQDHQSVHTTLEFSCTFCAQSYRLDSQLQRHIKRVHIKEKTTFRCVICQSTFTRKSTYRDHALRQHKELTGNLMTEFLQKIKKSIPEEFKT